MMTKSVSKFGLFLLVPTVHGASSLYLSEEFGSGDPASSAVFANFLDSASLTQAEVVNTLTTPGNYAVWADIADPGAVTSTAIDFAGTSVGISISGWNTSTNLLSGPSGNAVLDGFGIDGSAMQASSPRPGFASGTGSGAYIGTNNGSGSDGIRNAVTFDLTSFAGGGVYSFGIFGGDLETGGPGSPLGFLYVQFANGDTETIDYTPDPNLLPATFSGNNNTSAAYGNNTGRFVGIADDTRVITSVTFVVGDDDINDNGDSEQLSFIAPMVFLNFDGTTAVPLVPDNVPEPSVVFLAGAALLVPLLRRRKEI